jgi:1-acyl-sn-glycerol-3-phosphate acyltransferase
MTAHAAAGVIFRRHAMPERVVAVDRSGVRVGGFLPCSRTRRRRTGRHACRGSRLQKSHTESAPAAFLQLRRLFEGLCLVLSVVFFGLLCLGWSVVAAPLLLLPTALGRRCGRWGISRGFRLFFYGVRRCGIVRFDPAALEALNEGPPVVLAPNHPGFMDAICIVAYVPRVACVFKAAILDNVFLGIGARLARYIRHEPPRTMIRTAVAELQRGGIVLLFPEGTRTTRAPINPLQAGVGIIAQQAGVPVQTLIIESDSPYGSKGYPLFRMPWVPLTFRMRLGRRFDPPADTRAFVTELDRYFRQALAGAPQQRWLESGTKRADSSSL